ncbi:MAG: DUF882 domain-containing protein [Rhizobiales bacterium]|nr:DUF882 domain-containing protein [Hyphomicrobiales bacterium]
MLLRTGARLSVASLFLLGANNALQTAIAEGDTRTISFHHLHTGEDLTITYKRNGRYDDDALKKIDWFMRDWRREQSVRMDPHLIDLLWETNREVGGSEAIQVVCGYRSPATNSMLRARSTGVAQFSQHTQGQAMDFYIPGVPLEKVRVVGLRLQRGGVGFYPTSGSPFVHLDTGTIRHWPRMTHDQLAKVFPDGRTVHVPSDGRPLSGYALALAEVEHRGAEPSATSLEAARDAGVITASIEQESAKPKRNLLARIFGTAKDEDELSAEPAVAPKRVHPPTRVASLTPPTVRIAVERIVPLPAARPKAVAVAAAKPKPAARKFVTASVSLPESLFDTRGYWRGAVEIGALPPPAAASPFETAGIDSTATGSTGNVALGYAAESETQAPVRARPMGSSMPRLPATAALMPVSSNATLIAKPPLTAAMSQISGTPVDPWLRAAVLTPSVSDFMNTTQLGPVDQRPLNELLHKPSQSLVMTFSAEPHLGMLADRFSGQAVVFLATATFTPQTTAAVTFNGAIASLR